MPYRQHRLVRPLKALAKQRRKGCTCAEHALLRTLLLLLLLCACVCVDQLVVWACLDILLTFPAWWRGRRSRVSDYYQHYCSRCKCPSYDVNIIVVRYTPHICIARWVLSPLFARSLSAIATYVRRLLLILILTVHTTKCKR